MILDPPTRALKVAAAQLSSTGPRPANDDAIGIRIPDGELLRDKGVALAVADGISAERSGRQASEVAVQGFLADYYATPERWPVKASGERVLSALNRWLYGQGQHYHSAHEGCLTTLTALVLRSRTAHVFHVGDTRLYRLRQGRLELLTRDHAIRINADNTYLTRALGMDWYVEIDYFTQPLEAGDLFFASSDGVHGFLHGPLLESILRDGTRSLEERCRHILTLAAEYGSNDNLSCQLLEVLSLPPPSAEDTRFLADPLPPPPLLSAGQVLDGLAVTERLHEGSHFRLYRVRDEQGRLLVLRAPRQGDEESRARLGTIEWIARHCPSPHLVGTESPTRARQCLYLVEPWLPGQPLRQWLAINPLPPLDIVLDLAAQLVAGLQALHGQGVLHRDLRPENIRVTPGGVLFLTGLDNAGIGPDPAGIPPLRSRYAAPEQWQQGPLDGRADQFALAVILYECLTGHHPYGEPYGRSAGPRALRQLRYRPAPTVNPRVPPLLDRALATALALAPRDRFDSLGRFLDALRAPATTAADARPALPERQPARLGQLAGSLLLLLNLILALCLILR